MSGASHVTRVSHVSINVADMDRSIAFYRDTFGWEMLFDEHMEGPAFDAITGISGAAGRACGGRIRDIRVELMCFNFTPHAPPGAGLGLFLVTNVARTLRGSVAARNRAQGGAVVTLTLPLQAIVLDENQTHGR